MSSATAVNSCSAPRSIGRRISCFARSTRPGRSEEPPTMTTPAGKSCMGDVFELSMKNFKNIPHTGFDNLGEFQARVYRAFPLDKIGEADVFPLREFSRETR